MNIGKNLTDLRKQKGLSRQNLADKLEISVHTYIKYENESVKPPYETLIKLAKFYNVTTDYLLGVEPAPNPLADLNLRVDDKKFIELYSALPEYAKQIFVDTMSKLAQAAEQANQRQRHVERLGDIEDAREQEEQARAKDVI